jgi:Flp pilus assembly protein TadD
VAQREGGALGDAAAFPLGVRLANAAVSCVRYLWKTAWPMNLSVLYPYPGGGYPLWKVTAAVAILGGISCAVFRARRERPSLIVGWLWFLLTLLPVIGLVQVGLQAMADRYTYLPLVGIFVVLAWCLPEPEGSGAVRRLELALGAAATTALAGLAMLTFVQVGYWQDDVGLFEHALAVVGDDAVVHNDLGVVLFERGRVKEAVGHYYRALGMEPGYARAHANLATALKAQGRLEAAIAQAQEAVALSGGAGHKALLGAMLMEHGDWEEAEARLSEALRADPDDLDARNNLGVLLAEQGRVGEAIGQFKMVLSVDPGNLAADRNLERARSLSARRP